VIGLAILLGVTGAAAGLGWANSWWRQSGQKAAEEPVRDHWEQAKRASDDGDAALAKTHLEAILAFCPLNSQAQFLMARNCRRLHDSESWPHLLLAESLGWPRDQWVLEERLMQAEAGDVWNVEEALLDKLNRLPPEERVILEGLVKGYLNSARFLDATEIATTWIKRYPSDWLAFLYRGRGYQGLARWDEAISDFRHVLAIRPDSIAATHWLADALLAFHNFEGALDSYQAYYNLVPGDWEALFAIAECQYSLGQPEAGTTVENLLAKHPRHLGGLVLSARINLAENEADKALLRLRQAQAISPRDPEVLQILIGALRQLNRHKEADQVNDQYGQILELAKQLSQLNEKIQNEPADASLRYDAGKLSLELGQEKAGSDWFQSVFYIDPDHRPTHLALAAYWAKHGQPQRAAYHRRRAEGKRR
jgi:tetratricopeptide (TPR) repeat protein